MASVVGTKRQIAAIRGPNPPRHGQCYRLRARSDATQRKAWKILTGSHAALCDPYRSKNPAGQSPDRPTPFMTYRSSSVSKPPARNSRNNRRNQNGRPNLLSVNQDRRAAGRGRGVDLGGPGTFK